MSEDVPDVLVVVLDTARAANVSCYGYERETTPNLDALAATGVRFENAIAPAPWTLPSHASMFTGLLPFDHGAHARNYKLFEDLPTLAEELRDVGYETTLISNNGWLSDSFGILRGFEHVYELWKLFQTDTDVVEPYREYVKHTDLLRNPGALLSFVSTVMQSGSLLKDAANLGYGMYHRDDRHHSGDRITRIAKDHLSGDGPAFVVANYLEPHLRYFPPEPYRSRFLPDDVSDEEARTVPQDVYEVQFGDATLDDRQRRILSGLYDGEMSHADSYVGELVGFLRRTGRLDETLMVVVGDHGENVGDHGLLGHNSSLHDTVLRVPMVIRPPGGADGRVESGTVQLTDLFRTVLAAAGLDGPTREGPAFSYDLLASDRGGRPDVAISQYAGLQLETNRITAEYPETDIAAYDRSLSAVYRGGAKLVLKGTGERELYEVPPAVPKERPLSMDEEQADRLEATLEEYSSGLEDSEGSVPEVDTAVESRLKDLGYHR